MDVGRNSNINAIKLCLISCIVKPLLSVY